MNYTPRRPGTISFPLPYSQTTGQDLLIFGLETPDLRNWFKIGPLTIYPGRNLERYLSGYDADTVLQVVDRDPDPKLAKLVGEGTDPKERLLTPVDDSLLPLRLWKPGWISAIPVMPVVRSGGLVAYQDISPLEEQIWSEPMRYGLLKKDLKGIRRLRHLLDMIPMGQFAVACRRFSRSYTYWLKGDVDDCLVDLVVALESITSRGGDSIRQSMALRTALLVGVTPEERRTIERKVKKFYDHRSQIVHGGAVGDKVEEARFMDMEELRSLVRDTLKAAMSVFAGGRVDEAKTVAEAIDLFLYELPASALKY